MRFLAAAFLSACVTTSLFGQTATTTASTAPSADPQAASLVALATVSQMGTNVIQDVTLAGTVTQHAGTDSNGSITLSADTAGHSKVVFSLDSGTRSEYSSGPGDASACSWTDSKGTSHDVPIHNCWNNGAWFLPTLPLSTGLANGRVAFTYGGTETTATATVEHLSSNRQIKSGKASALSLIQKLSRDDLSFDSTTHLPTSLKFLTHPDSDAKTDIPVEIRFSDYRDVNGVKIPFHIEKLLNGSSFLDITISSATFNNGPVTK